MLPHIIDHGRANACRVKLCRGQGGAAPWPERRPVPNPTPRSASSSCGAMGSVRKSRRPRSPCCASSIACSGSGFPSRTCRSATRPCARRARPCRMRPSLPRRRPTASFSDRSRTTNIRRSRRAGSTRRASCASASTCSPISARPARAPASAALRQRGGSRHRAREHRGLLRRPQHVHGSRRVHADAGLALAMRKITREGSTRIARAAFDSPRSAAGKVTAVHKANVLRVSDGLFLEWCATVRRRLSRRRLRGAASSTRWRRCWCATPRASTSS